MATKTEIYKAWLAHTGDATYQNAEFIIEDNAVAWFDNSSAYFGQYDTYAELAEALLDESGAVDEVLGKVDDSLAPYITFDYEMYGRDLDLGGDLWSEEIDGETHWYWSNY